MAMPRTRPCNYQSTARRRPEMLRVFVDATLAATFFVATCLMAICTGILLAEAHEIQFPVIAFMGLFTLILLGGATSHYYYQAIDTYNTIRRK
jgi:hypothetical protein